ncbi:MAG: hypothetical protein ACJ796_05080 [Gemmatimonadaceae bacterium]
MTGGAHSNECWASAVTGLTTKGLMPPAAVQATIVRTRQAGEGLRAIMAILSWTPCGVRP